MLRRNDIALLTVLSMSIAAGVLFPDMGRPLQPYIQFYVMFLLFLSFLSIKVSEIWAIFIKSWIQVAWLTFLKLLLLPTLTYIAFKWIWPSFALGAMLLAGISTGAVAPFISKLVGAHTPLVLALTIITTLLVPFSLPGLVEILVGRNMEIPLLDMIRLLAEVIFIPMLAGELLRRLSPKLTEGLKLCGFPLSLLCFSLIGLAVFSRYSTFFYQQPDFVIAALGIAIVLGGIFMLIGLLLFWRSGLPRQLSAAIALGNINNILIIVFSAQFFGPLESTLAAFYMFSFFGLIVPLRIFRHWREKGDFKRLQG